MYNAHSVYVVFSDLTDPSLFTGGAIERYELISYVVHRKMHNRYLVTRMEQTVHRIIEAARIQIHKPMVSRQESWDLREFEEILLAFCFYCHGEFAQLFETLEGLPYVALFSWEISDVPKGRGDLT